MAFLSGLELLFFLVTLGVVLSISVPFTGTLVRFRASYNPRGLALDAEGGAEPFTGPVVNSYFGMWARVYRIEGLAGLYKGFMPTAVTALVVSVFAIAFMSTSRPMGGRYTTPDAGVIATFFYSLFYALVSLPAMIITSRAIITPYRLPTFNPVVSLRVLLTPTERARPWTLYAAPGLLASQVLHISYVVFILNGVGRLLLSAPEDWKDGFESWRVAAYLTLSILSTVILTPLEVVSTRLAIQRNHASADFNTMSPEVDAPEELADYYGDSEDVIGLRSERDPYTGLVDCAKRIVDEEGLRALYRGWWVTALGGLAKA